jgi:hypothetical protein
MKFVQFIFVTFSILSGIVSESTKEEAFWKVSPESVVSIIGKTNINTFECSSFKYSGKSILSEVIYPEAEYTIWSGEVMLESTSFDCLNRLMTKDFHNSVQSDEYPHIRIGFIDLVRRDLSPTQEELTGNVEITLAGVSKKFPLSCTLFKDDNGKTLLKGSQEVSFRDFEMKPPTKFLGTVKVKNELQVHFRLVLEKI